MTRILMYLAVAYCVASGLQAETTRNWIRQWNDTYNIDNDPNEPSTEYFTISQSLARIEIIKAEPNEPFVFEACTDVEDPNSPDPNFPQWIPCVYPGVINYIGDGEGNGPPTEFTITVVGQGEHEFGADDVKQIDFGNGDNVTIGRIEIHGNLGDSTYPNRIMYADTITGPLLIGGSIADHIDIDLLAGDIVCQNMLNLTMQTLSTDPLPNITIAGVYDHHILLDTDKQEGCTFDTLRFGALGSNGVVDVAFVENLNVTENCTGTIMLSDNLDNATIGVDLSGEAPEITGTLDGTLEVGGDAGILDSELDESLQIGAIGSETRSGTLTVGNYLHFITVYGACKGNVTIGEDLVASFWLGDVESGSTIDVQGNVTGYNQIGTWPAPADLHGTFHAATVIGSVVLYGNLDGMIETDSDGGNLNVYGDVEPSGSILVGGSCQYLGALLDMMGTISIGGEVSDGIRIGMLKENGGELGGTLAIGADLEGFLHVYGDVTQADATVPTIHIGGDVTGGVIAGERSIIVDGTLAGVIAIDGKLDNVVAEGPEIYVVDDLLADPNDPNKLGAITIDYDGCDDGDDWDPNATIQVGENVYTGNTPSARVYEITCCRGDMDNDEDTDGDDTNTFGTALADPNAYALVFPGLVGSMPWHGDMDCDEDLDGDDDFPLDSWVAYGACCTDECQYLACRADFNESGSVGAADLAELLSRYNECTGDPGYDIRVDLDESGCINVGDLAALNGVYGDPCVCFGEGERGGGGEGKRGAAVELSIEPYNTGGYRGNGFVGEVDHFAFDLMVEVGDGDDDWTTAGAVVTAANGAAFRLAGKPTSIEPYATFVSPPRDSSGKGEEEGESGAEVIGAYLPPAGEYGFDSGLINLDWFDLVESADGPGAVMRLVIDVSEVDGADVSGGFGSVYFSTTGPASGGDVKVADLSSAAGTRAAGDTLDTLTGELYVTGK